MRIINKKDEAKEILESLISEGQHMTKLNRKIYGTTITEAQKLLKTL
ncbi:hypothetical protein [Hyunsoonleella pacifica]|nr:hypothetical protein [Hyunsoonleella pacifica]